jgi:ABC-type uncharacterized transport system fused permease/ATPase subunit
MTAPQQFPALWLRAKMERWLDLWKVVCICTEGQLDTCLFFVFVPVTVTVSLLLTHLLVLHIAVLYALLWSNKAERLYSALWGLFWLSIALAGWRALRAALNEHIARRWRVRLSTELHLQLTTGKAFLERRYRCALLDERKKPVLGERSAHLLYTVASDAALAQRYEQVTASSLRLLSIDFVSLVTGGSGGAGGFLENVGTAVWQLRRAVRFMPMLLLVLGLVYVACSYGLIWFLAHRTERVTVELDANETMLRTQYTSVVEKAEALALCSCSQDVFDALLAQLASCHLSMPQLVRYRLPLVFVQQLSGYGNAWMAYAAAAFASSRLGMTMDGQQALEKRVQWTSQLIAELMQLLGSLSGLLQLTVDMRHHALHANRLLTLCRSLSACARSSAAHDTLVNISFPETKDLLWLERVRLRVPANHQLLLRDVHIRLRFGEHTLVEGPSGSGKSSFMRALRGIWSFEGFDSAKGSRLHLPTKALFLPTEPHLPICSSGFCLAACLHHGCFRDRSECLAAGHVAGHDTREMSDALQRVGLSLKVQQAGGLYAVCRWHQMLSRAEQQRLSIARVLYLRPPLVIMDESLRGLSAKTATILLRACMDHGITVLYLRPPASEWLELFPKRYAIDSNGRLQPRS